jgi:hypothetical protein
MSLETATEVMDVRFSVAFAPFDGALHSLKINEGKMV